MHNVEKSLGFYRISLCHHSININKFHSQESTLTLRCLKPYHSLPMFHSYDNTITEVILTLSKFSEEPRKDTCLREKANVCYFSGTCACFQVLIIIISEDKSRLGLQNLNRSTFSSETSLVFYSNEFKELKILVLIVTKAGRAP